MKILLYLVIIYIYIGSNCIFNTIKIPLDQNKRAKRIICSNEIKIGNNVYFEGAIIISNGISIGNNVIIKANRILIKIFQIIV